RAGTARAPARVAAADRAAPGGPRRRARRYSAARARPTSRRARGRRAATRARRERRRRAWAGRRPARSSRGPLGDAAARRAGRRRAPQHLEAGRQRTAVARREPEAQEQAVVVGAGRILVGRARVVDDVIVEKLQVAGPELHGERQLLAQRGVQVERLVLPRAHPRHLRQLLRGLHERARVLRGELAGVLGEDGQRVDLPLAAVLLTLAAAPVVAEQERVEVGAPRADRLGHAHGAHDLAQPARARRAHAEQAHDVAAVGVKTQRAARARLAARRAAEDRVDRGPLANLAVARDLVAHLADQLAARVLVADVAEVAAQAPGEILQLLTGVAIDGDAAQEHDAPPVLELIQ